MLDLDVAAALIDQADDVLTGAVRQLATRAASTPTKRSPTTSHTAASALATARSSLTYAAKGEVEAQLVATFLALVLADLATRALGTRSVLGVGRRVVHTLSIVRRDVPATPRSSRPSPSHRVLVHLGEDFAMVAELFHRFADEQVRPHAEHVHRTNADIPESIIEGLSELGGFGLSIPEAFGGSSSGGESEYVGMVVATEELSWASLGVGGSLITRPEILSAPCCTVARKEQQAHWLPRLAAPKRSVPSAVTEPDYARTSRDSPRAPRRHLGGWLIQRPQTWCTFAARAEVLLLLARTDPTARWPIGASRSFSSRSPRRRHGFPSAKIRERRSRHADGRFEGPAIDTIGYRGMHSYELSFDNWFVPRRQPRRCRSRTRQGLYYRWPASRTGDCRPRRAPSRHAGRLRRGARVRATRVVFGEAILDFELTRTKARHHGPAESSAPGSSHSNVRAPNGSRQAARSKRRMAKA